MRVEGKGGTVMKELDSPKNLMINEPSRKNTQNFQFAVQIEILQENTLFDIPPHIVGSVAQHAYVQICYSLCCHKN